MKVPKEIIQIIEHEAKYPFQDETKESIRRSRDTALEYIQIYKDNKAIYDEFEKRKNILLEWLKSIKEEEYGK